MTVAYIWVRQAGRGRMVPRAPRLLMIAAALVLLPLLQARASEPGSGRTITRHEAPPTSPSPTTPSRPKLIRAFVVDDKLSALRRDPEEGAPVLHRLRLAHQVFLIESRNHSQSTYSRVAVSTRTRGWLHRAAVVVPGRSGDDEALLKLIRSTTDSADRMVLCRIMDDHFKTSPLDKQALLILGEEADRVARSLGKKANKRLTGLKSDALRAQIHDYYVNDPALDKYSRLSVRFKYNQATSEYIYDGAAYSAIIKKFPASEEAAIARQRLEKDAEKLAVRADWLQYEQL